MFSLAFDQLKLRPQDGGGVTPKIRKTHTVSTEAVQVLSRPPSARLRQGVFGQPD